MNITRGNLVSFACCATRWNVACNTWIAPQHSLLLKKDHMHSIFIENCGVHCWRSKMMQSSDSNETHKVIWNSQNVKWGSVPKVMTRYRNGTCSMVSNHFWAALYQLSQLFNFCAVSSSFCLLNRVGSKAKDMEHWHSVLDRLRSVFSWRSFGYIMEVETRNISLNIPVRLAIRTQLQTEKNYFKSVCSKPQNMFHYLKTRWVIEMKLACLHVRLWSECVVMRVVKLE